MMDIRERVPSDILDYQQLTSLLDAYAKPRDRIRSFLADGSLVRLRKGLYTFSERYRHGPVHRGVVANLVYGPSYLSLDYALSRYGMIPERVINVTSVTTGESRRFTTPVGVFTYHHLAAHRYSVGVVWTEDEDASFLIASPEKALVDKVWTDKRFSPARMHDYQAYLFDDLRVDEGRASALSMNRLNEIAESYRSRKVNMLVRFLARQFGEQQ